MTWPLAAGIANPHTSTCATCSQLVWRDAGAPLQFAVIVALIILVLAWWLGLQLDEGAD